MQRLTLVGVNLLFLWSLSPLGGQASLRLLGKSTSTVEVFRSLRYLSTGPGSTVWTMTSGTYVETDGSLTQVEALYGAALLGAKQVKEGPEDTWGNVKIPYLDHMNVSTSKSRDWINIEDKSHPPEDYFSLVGMPVIGRPLDRDGSFNLETSHLTVDCKPFVKASVLKNNFTELEKLVPGQVWKNMSDKNSPWGNDDLVGGKRATFFLQTDISLDNGGDDGNGRFNSYLGYVNTTRTGKEFPQRQITYASSYQVDPLGNTMLNIANCSIGQIHVETSIKCIKDRCSAVKVRPSQMDLRDPRTTPLDHILIAEKALKAFPQAFGWTRGSSPTEQFLYNTTSFQLVSPTTDMGNNAGWVDLASVEPKLFAKRLALLLNTYYQLTIAPNAFLGDLPQTNMSAFGPETFPIGDVDAFLPKNVSSRNTSFENWYNTFQSNTYNSGIYFIGATTNATISKPYPVFVCNFVWMSLLLVSSSTVLLIGAASLILKKRTLGPEMFGFVTSMTYENKYIKIPEGGSMLDAMERARLLKDVEVYVGDVHGNEDVGHIALAAGVPMRKLERGRLYC